MKINFRKISAIAASALMTGMTMGVAAAANYPAPFVSGSSANVAVVYGTGAGVSDLDFIHAGNIQKSLAESVTGGSVTVEGGESFVLEKTSSKFHFGDSLTGIYSVLDDGELEDFLADGTYKDTGIDEDYEQTITLESKSLELFADRDYNDEAPTFGFRWANGNKILTYEIEFDNEIPWEDLEETDLPIMDKEFYVVEADEGELVLLDSAEKDVLSEGESKTMAGKTVSIEYIEDDAVKFNVDGEITDTLTDTDKVFELEDGSYIVANDIMFASKESGVSKVEFSIGVGQLTLADGEEVEANDEAIDGLEVVFTDSGTGLTGLAFEWYSDDDSFLTEEDALTMPSPFDSIRLVFNGLDFPSEYETIALEPGETLTLAMENYDLPLMWWDGSDVLLGEEHYLLVLATAGNSTTYNATSEALTGGLELAEDNRFLVTSMDEDLGEIETLYYEVTTIDYDADDDFTVTLKDLISGDTITFEDEFDSEEVGDVTVELEAVNGTAGLAYFTFTGTDLHYNYTVSDTGMLVSLPTDVSTVTTSVHAQILFEEQNKDGDIGDSNEIINATVVVTDDDTIHVNGHSLTGDDVEESEDVMIAHQTSELASKVVWDTSEDDNEFEIQYYGEEVIAKVMVVGGDATVSAGESTLGNILVKDTEVSSVATKNLIVVGGSCINSAAAALVGGTKCGAAWTEATDIGTGQFLIQGYEDSTITTELALLVAGYEAEDTVKAVTYLINKDVDTSGTYKGTTSTETVVRVDTN